MKILLRLIPIVVLLFASPMAQGLDDNPPILVGVEDNSHDGIADSMIQKVKEKFRASRSFKLVSRDNPRVLLLIHLMRVQNGSMTVGSAIWVYQRPNDNEAVLLNDRVLYFTDKGQESTMDDLLVGTEKAYNMIPVMVEKSNKKR